MGKEFNEILVAQSALEDWFDLLNDQELLYVAKMVKPSIPGFSIKNFSKVPPKLLMKNTKKKVQSIGNPDEFFKQLVSDTVAEEFKGLEILELITKMNMNESFTPSQKLALLITSYPSYYAAHESFIKVEVKNSRDPIKGLGNNEYSLLEQMEAMIHVRKDDFAGEVEFIFENDLQFDKMEEIAPDRYETIRDYLNDKGLPIPNKGMFLQLLKVYNEDEFTGWSDPEKIAFYKLVVQDIVAIHKTLYEFIDVLDDEKDDQISALKDRIAIYDQDLITINNLYQEQMKQVKETEKEIAKLQKDKAQLEQQIKQMKGEHAHEVKKLNKNMKEAAEEMARMKEDRIEIDAIKLFKGESICLLSQPDHRTIPLFLEDDQYIYFSNRVEFQKIVNQEHLQGKILFVNTDGLSTKDTFFCEKELKTRVW
ncbi:hypothetical protein NC797_17940 [Aquibacillus sp. 3ASR75-11]|uniref:Uncharacterized protein n=1 Tax=Terrihalobacillus insolitus TaxID=2950438 RepID=A0A9X3WVC2_9BACI|nr:hypothetical protein [Terrihalobacillus insolitus]MDC3426350.1 hypothetical protein [Terrihalobacillus insolitus]